MFVFVCMPCFMKHKFDNNPKEELEGDLCALHCCWEIHILIC